MREIKASGLIIFFAGFLLFNGMFFIDSYVLPTKLSSLIIDLEKRRAFLEEAAPMLNRSYPNAVEFVADMDQAIAQVNLDALETYGLSAREKNSMAELFAEQVDLNELDKVFPDQDEVAVFKIKAIRDFGGWLDGRTPSSGDELEGWIGLIDRNIREYGIVQRFGFDRYQEKDLKYGLVKLSSVGPISNHPMVFMFLTIGLMVAGAVIYILPFLATKPGTRNGGIFHRASTRGGWLGMLVGTWLIAFYVVLYFFNEFMTPWVIMVDPLSLWLKGSPAGPFFLYGFLYTLVILVMGIRMLIKYRHSRYQLLRTVSVMFFQLAFAFLIPEILLRLNQPYYDFKNIWPLDYDFFFETELSKLMEGGGLGIFMLVWGLVLVVVAVPVLVYFFGKRWYCSWVCGCGGLAETAGDPYRQLSSKSLRAWKLERYMIHAVLGFAVIMTAGVLYTYFSGSSEVFGISTFALRESYGAWIGAGFAGVVGTGFYPFMGNRVWCRFGCPLAAYLGIVQRFKSRFRITTNGGQCISCGNCSTYCEMGIDVRWYAQRGQNVVRSSCVGCGICSEVCPRGVLKLELKEEKGRFGTAELPG